MEMHQVRYFLALCEEHNFTRAAQACHVTQPSLTRAIHFLEQELGGALFHRERTGTQLSELGRTVRPYLEEVYAKAQAAQAEARAFGQQRRIRLTLGVMCTIQPDALVALISGLRTRHADLELDIVDASAGALEERLLAGKLKVALYCLPGREPDPRLHPLALFREPMVIAVAAGHPLAARNVIRPQDLSGQHYVHRLNCEFRGYAGPIWEAQGCTNCETIYRSERDDWILAMIAAGLGFGFMPRSCVTHPGVVARPLVEPDFWREVNLVTVRGRPHAPAVGALLREAMRAEWFGAPALAAERERARTVAP